MNIAIYTVKHVADTFYVMQEETDLIVAASGNRDVALEAMRGLNACAAPYRLDNLPIYSAVLD